MIKYVLFLMFVVSNDFAYVSAQECWVPKNTRRYLRTVYAPAQSNPQPVAMGNMCHGYHAYAVKRCFELGISYDDAYWVIAILSRAETDGTRLSMRDFLKGFNEFQEAFKKIKENASHSNDLNAPQQGGGSSCSSVVSQDSEQGLEVSRFIDIQLLCYT